MTERLLISRLGHRGDGVVDTPAGPVFVPGALPGEVVEVEAVAGHPGRPRLLQIEQPSPDRVAPICPHFGICGGCATQHIGWQRYAAWKRALVVDALAQAGIEVAVHDVIDAQGDGRRRAVFHARRGTHDVLEVGFAAQRSHQVVAIDRCPVLAPGLAGAVQAAWAVAEVLAPTRKPLDIQMTATHAGIDVDVRGSGPLSADCSAALARVGAAHRLARVTRHGELVIQRAPPTIDIGRARLTLPPGAFLQATEQGEATLAQLVGQHVGKAKRVADLFAGVGPFSLRLAERARVLAVDGDTPAVSALRQAVASTPGLKPVEAQVRDLFRRPLVAQELSGCDAVVFDPPRQGAEAQARELARSRVPTVVAVSCNPSTFARDARLLIDGGYRLDAVTPIDQFRYSAHVELVAKLVR
jgi:23S rRNA (uracil1939-C5)-methyltransferase